MLSPTASTFFSNGALVHPHPGFTLRILSVSSPVEYSQKTWLMVEFWGTYPKSNIVSGMVNLGALVADPVSNKTSTTVQSTHTILFISNA